MIFKDAKSVIDTIRAGDEVAKIRAANRVRVNDAANACPPLSDEEQKAWKLKVNVKSFEDSDDITPDALPRCLDGSGNLAAASDFTPGGASKIVLVWVCFEWEFAKSIPFLNFSDMNGGSRLIQATTTFRTEPYN